MGQVWNLPKTLETAVHSSHNTHIITEHCTSHSTSDHFHMQRISQHDSQQTLWFLTRAPTPVNRDHTLPCLTQLAAGSCRRCQTPNWLSDADGRQRPLAPSSKSPPLRVRHFHFESVSPTWPVGWLPDFATLYSFSTLSLSDVPVNPPQSFPWLRMSSSKYFFPPLRIPCFRRDFLFISLRGSSLFPIP